MIIIKTKVKTMKIKIVRGNQNGYNEKVVFKALRAAGAVLNGAKELNDNGSYKAVNPGMSLVDDEVTLEDSWFSDNQQTMETIVQAVEKATGLKLKISEVSSTRIVGYEVVNQERYDSTTGKEIQASQQKYQGPSQSQS